MTPNVLLRIKTAWEKETINDDRVMLWAAFTLCFFSFMRSGEIGANSESDFDPTRNLTMQDVAIDNLTNPQILKIRLKCSKTDPFREGSDIFLARTHDELAMPSHGYAGLASKKKGETSCRRSFVHTASGGTTDTQQLRSALQGGVY